MMGERYQSDSNEIRDSRRFVGSSVIDGSDERTVIGTDADGNGASPGKSSDQRDRRVHPYRKLTNSLTNRLI